METKQENVIPTDYAEVMQKSYIDYAMSVIISRALPDVRDGLKPVQRRTLYDMYELGIRYDRPYRKCARIVGDTMGNTGRRTWKLRFHRGRRCSCHAIYRSQTGETDTGCLPRRSG